MDKEKVKMLTNILTDTYREACGLDYESPYELLVATILSAQCTDVRVNLVTKELFAKASTPEQMDKLGYDGILNIIRPCGLCFTKTKNILAASKMLTEEYNGYVPDDFDELIKLPGVGVKTANVVLSNAFGQDRIAVDTHVFRVSSRLNLARQKTPEKTGEVLYDLIDEGYRTKMHHALIWHGRKVCSARNPKCEVCPVYELCEYELKKSKN